MPRAVAKRAASRPNHSTDEGQSSKNARKTHASPAESNGSRATTASRRAASSIDRGHKRGTEVVVEVAIPCGSGAAKKNVESSCRSDSHHENGTDLWEVGANPGNAPEPDEESSVPFEDARSNPRSSPETVNGTRSLAFDEPISWRAGKAIGIQELQRRLQKLALELRGLGQEEVQQQSCTKAAKELASINLLSHKDAGVRAWTACCLVDVFRLFAPEAPYTTAQLKDIFTLIIERIVPALADPANAYNSQHVYVLNSLAQVKSIVLVTDIPHAESLVSMLFETAFDLVAGVSRSSSGPQLGKSTEFDLIAILTILIDESPTLAPSVVDILVAQFLRVDPDVVRGSKHKSTRLPGQSTLLLKQLPPSYHMAATVCNTCPDRLSRCISQYFNDIVVNSSSSGLGSEDAIDASDENLRGLRKVHQLLRELWRACPALLQNVIPQLETELAAENVQLRLLATETCGDLISGISAAGPPPPISRDPAAYPYVSFAEVPPASDLLTKPCSPHAFSQSHHQAYQSFLGRRLDKSPLIRAAWTISIGRILTTAAGGVGLDKQDEQRLLLDLAKMLADSDDKVRLTAVEAVGLFSAHDAVMKLGNQPTLLAGLADRLRDRKHSIRIAAVRVCGQLWAATVGDIISGNKQAISTTGSMPTNILETYFTNDLDIHQLLDQVLHEQLLPLNFPKSKTTENPDLVRTERILALVGGLTEKGRKVFYLLQKRQTMLVPVVRMFLQRCEEFNGGVTTPETKVVKAHMTKLIEHLARPFPDPSKVAEFLWRFAKIHDRRSYQLIRFCMAPESDYRTVVKAIREFSRRMEQVSAEMLLFLTSFLYRLSVLVYNRSHVPFLLQASRSSPNASTAQEILRDISTISPEVLKAQVQEICQQIQDGTAVLENLRICASFATRFPSEISTSRDFVRSLMAHVTKGEPAQLAKYAVKVLGVSHVRQIVALASKGLKHGVTGFCPRMAALSQVLLLDPDQDLDAVSGIATNEIHDSADLEAQSWSLRFLVNRIRSCPATEDLAALAEPTYGELSHLLQDEGRLRLLAAKLVLKLSMQKSTDALLTPVMFNHLGTITHDSKLYVRTEFLTKLHKYLTASLLPQRFYLLPFLFARDSDLQAGNMAWIRSRHQILSRAQDTNMIMESTITRLISFFAHCPEPEDLLETAHCFLFYLNAVASEDNLSYILHLTQRVKQCHDALEGPDERLYVLSDLVQSAIRHFEELHNWNIETLPGKAALPRSLFSEIRDHEQAIMIAERDYLPREIREEMGSLVRNSVRQVRGRKRINQEEDRLMKRLKPNGKVKVKPKSTIISAAKRRSGRVSSGPRYKDESDSPSSQVNDDPSESDSSSNAQAETGRSGRRSSRRTR